MSGGAGLGLLLAALSAVFNGSFGVLTKLPQARSMPPLVLTYWVSEGVGLSGLLLLAVPPRVFCWQGVLSGMMFVLSAANAVTAIGLVGLSAGTGVWCGTAVIVSFTYGVLVAGDKVHHMGLAAAALALILCGIAGIALAAWAGGSADNAGHHVGAESRTGSNAAAALQAANRAEGGGDSEEPLLLNGADSVAATEVDTPHLGHNLPPGSRALLGLLTAVLAGGIGGLILAPMLRAPEEARGVQYVPSMAVGALLLAPILTAFLTSVTNTISFIQATSARAAGPGMAAGFIWNVGNMCSILATLDPRVGLAVAMPIMQCGLFVAGIWGICLFSEIRGWKALAGYWLSGATLVAGAALLAAAKGG